MARRWLKAAIFSFVSLVLLAWVVGPLKPFQDCIHEHKNYHAYDALRDKPLLIIQTRTRVRLHLACAVDTAGQYQTTLLILSGLLVAGFTGTLWWATLGMVRIGRNQHVEMERATSVAQAAADAAMKSAQVAEASLTILECPLLLMQIVPRQIGYFDRAKWPMTVFPPVNISFVNYGRTPAIVSHAGADVVLADNMPKNIKGRAGRRLVWITNVVLHKESLGEIELRVAPPHSLRSKKLP